MTTATRSITFALLAICILMGTRGPALANTELVPGSRLVFPYIDISAGRETFLMITNSGNLYAPVHLEFYAQSCIRTDTAIILSPGDTAAYQVSLFPGILSFPTPPLGSAQQHKAGIGWADVDVRAENGGVVTTSSTGVEYNGLMGEAIIVDAAGDFLFSYSAAASQGFAAGGFAKKTVDGQTMPSGPIVARNAPGNATSWTGAYETYPSHLYIPSYFAEDHCGTHGNAREAYISVVAPADAWRKEAPGQGLGTGTNLVHLSVLGFDGNENKVSDYAVAHHVNGRLCNLFPVIATREEYHNPVGFYPDMDQTFGVKNAVGWLDLVNMADTPSDAVTGPAPNSSFSAAHGFDTSTRHRGMVGVLFEVDTIEKTKFSPGGKDKLKKPFKVQVPTRGVAVRAWADPASAIDWPCFGSEVSELVIGGGSGFNTPTCITQELSVQPTWLREHAQTLNGGGGGITGGQ